MYGNTAVYASVASYTQMWVYHSSDLRWEVFLANVIKVPSIKELKMLAK
jgi:hypothetical protein